MASANDTASMALFCDFENIALGVRDAQYEKFDIRPVLERLLAKGSIVVKKAYCDWDRYKGFKAAMHEANFELIEIPHVRQSGKNSADIRMVVDALDLCYTKAHVDTFVIISGDSDFSPLVSKLRENAKRVIGVGVKQSCSDLLVTNCDEFIYYDDLVRDREGQRTAERREREKRSPEEEARRKEKQEERKAKAVGIVSATFADLIADRGDSERIWASVLKEVVKRRNPGFNESYYGFRTFGNLLEEAASRGLLGFGRDDKGAFVFRAPARPAATEVEAAEIASAVIAALEPEAEPGSMAMPHAEVAEPSSTGRRRGGRRGRSAKDRLPTEESVAITPVSLGKVADLESDSPASFLPPVDIPRTDASSDGPKPPRGGRGRGGRQSAKAGGTIAEEAVDQAAVEAAVSETLPAGPAVSPAEESKPAKAKPKRSPRTAKKTKATEVTEG